ncbi:tachylectin-related carbohydrate-binding protein [Phormidium nigroviride]
MKNCFPPSLLRKIIYLSSISLAVGAFNYSNISYADVEGIPYNQEFPNAQYPYAQAPDGCSGWQNTRQVRDTWGPVNFTGSCDNHDRCYYTLGFNWNTCNERFYSDLRAACERDLRVWVPPVTVKGVTITPGFHTPPEPASLRACYAIASGYYGGVQAGVLLDVFNEAQNKQRRYEEWVASIRSPSLVSSDLCWYQHSGWQDGSTSWASNNCTKVGSGWNFRTVFASSNGVIYGINANNELLWYQHRGWQDGSASWASGTGTRVGTGWSFGTVFASSNGVIYGINANKELCWYKHNGWQNGSASWASNNCTKVGSGWNFKTVFATNNGIIYAIRDNGDLLWYKHNGWQDGSTSFARGSGTKVGSGWNFKTVFASSDGVIYGIKDNGDLHWYKHNGWQEGSTSFAQGSGTKVGSGWNFRSAFATSNGTVYGIVR